MRAGTVTVRPLEEQDLPAADHVFRLAFGTMLGLADPLSFLAGSELVRFRFEAGSPAFAAEAEGELVGSAFVTRWGSLAVFGPLTVHPEHWDRGIGRRLWSECEAVLEDWAVSHTSLFTRPQGTKHVQLYQRLGFWPRFLTAVTAKEAPPASGREVERLSRLPAVRHDRFVEECRALTDAIHPGLDLEHELRAVLELGAGDVVHVSEDEGLAGFAICHAGAGSEAVLETCYVKFAAARPGAGARARLERLMEAVEEFAATVGVTRLEAGVNLAREAAARVLASSGYRAFLYGVAMHRPNDPGYDTPNAFVLDDWR